MIIRNKYKQDRKLLQNTFGCNESSFKKKKYKPGIHMSTKPFSTFYGKLLNQRQKLKAFYRNMKNKQLKSLIVNNLKYKNYKERIISALESRADTILFRSGIVKSFQLARQLINHRHVKCGEIFILSPSQKITTTTPIEFTETGKKIVSKHLEKIGRNVPTHINVDKEGLKIILNTTCLPKKESQVHFATPISIDEVIKSYRL